jgi:hypothetical protein
MLKHVMLAHIPSTHRVRFAFVNDSSGSAASPAPHHAVAERKHACRFSPLKPTVQEVTRDASTYG